MRRFNAILTGLILLLFLLHAILGGFQLLGLGSTALKTLAWVAVGLVALHTLIGAKLTADTLRVWKRTRVSYWRENKLFWARRLSGLAVMVFLVFHMTAFGTGGGAVYRLRWFDAAKLATQLLLVASIALHVVSNVKPLLIAFGIKGLRAWAADLLVILAVLLLFMAAALVVYYLRWNTI